MIELPKAKPLRFFLAVPTMLTGRHVIRLPRCSRCFDEVHDLEDGSATCVTVRGPYRAMDADQRSRWEHAVSEDARTKPMTREQP